LRHVLHAAHHDLSVQVVRQLAHHLRFHRELLVHQRQVVRQLRVLRDDDPLALRVELDAASTAQHLQDVQRT